MRIHILTPGFLTPNGRAFLMPLVLHQRALRDGGINVRLFDKVSPELTACDMLVVDSKFHRNDWSRGEVRVLETFFSWSEQVDRLIYFDTTDSTGCLQTELLPIVDIYCKNQILKNKTDYMRPHYGQRIFADYYHAKGEVTDRAPLYSTAVEDAALLAKIRVGWNSGLADYSVAGPMRMALFNRVPVRPLLRFPTRFTSPDAKRPIALQCRMGFGHGRESATHQRNRVRDILKGRLSTDKLTRRRFFAELRACRAVLSPFGFGEITLKDFEVFLTGGLLVKPSMAHLETWPDLFADDISMAAFNWDLSDLLEVIDEIEANRPHALDMAGEGQRRYFTVLAGKNAPELFVDQVKSAWLADRVVA